MEDGSIPDDSINASTVYIKDGENDSYCESYMARLHNTGIILNSKSNKPIRNCNCTYVTHGNVQYLSLVTFDNVLSNQSVIPDQTPTVHVKGHER